ncbi:MAG: lipoyl synthase [Chitinivibrionales bacterium]|nr:lipoyl synthase [Chitinivibrionales bacterium]
MQHEVKKTRTFPPWLHRPIPPHGKNMVVQNTLNTHAIHTVCQEARCPNQSECFSRGTATFLILGDTCTRNCAFCNISHGKPPAVDEQEPHRVAQAAATLKLSYVVLTMVTRDDLSDGGASVVAETIKELKNSIPTVSVEVLVSDFGGSTASIDAVLDQAPRVFNHNIETVASRYHIVRPQADYDRSLRVLAYAAQNPKNIPIKSGFMVGLGEREDEVFSLITDLFTAGVRILTIGQYLQPNPNTVAVHEYISPQQFDVYRKEAMARGFEQVYCGPFVRSSYRASELFAAHHTT